MAKEKIKLNVSGMSCVNCSNAIEKTTKKLKGLKDAKVSFASSSAEFEFDNKILNKAKIISAIQGLGFSVADDLKELEKSKNKEHNKLKTLFYTALVFTCLLIYFMFFPIKNNNSYLLFILATCTQFYSGSRFYRLSFKSLRHRNYDMNVLVALGTSVAYLYSSLVVFFPHIFPQNSRYLYFDGASIIITFVLLGRLLEENSRTKANDFLKKLMNLAPNLANKIEKNGEIIEVKAKDLKIGDLILIKAGEKVPSDVEITKGGADIDASMVSGESLPVFKGLGDKINAGTININASIEAKVLELAQNTSLAKIIDLLSKAQSKKMPIARLADKIANIFVPLVIFISILTFVIWYFLSGDFLSSLLSATAVLIISCPCALGLATPIAIVSAVGKGAKEGILIKNPEVLEIIKDIKYLCFDKTGTLTKGELKIKEMDIENLKYLGLIYGLELLSEHPISKAFVRYAKEKNIQAEKNFSDIKTLAGLGIKASWEKSSLLLGNLELMKNEKVKITKYFDSKIKEHLEHGFGLVIFSFDGSVKAVFSLEDEIKPHAKEVIQALKDKNIIPFLLTGDNTKTAENLAKVLGIENVHSQLLPDEKYNILKSLQKKGKVMFVGDGINDSLSIKQADIGVTLDSGSDISKDAGDLILINNDIKSVIKSINLSISSMNIIKQNLFWAFCYNIIGIPLAAGALYPFFGISLSPMYAGVAMSFSSFIVVSNSLRLKFKKLSDI